MSSGLAAPNVGLLAYSLSTATMLIQRMQSHRLEKFAQVSTPTGFVIMHSVIELA